MKYTDYHRDDFVKDEYFKSWVIEPNEDSNSFWQSFLANHPHKTSEIELSIDVIRSIYFSSGTETKMDEEVKDSLYERILLSSGRKTYAGSDTPMNTLYSKWTSTWWIPKVAAIILFAMIVGLLVEKYQPTISTQDISYASISKQTMAGQKLSIVLPDGSLVRLNSESKITYPEVFSDVREVAIQGEAFFDVIKDSEHPFIVKTNNVTTNVLGTTFNVKQSSDIGEVKVAVLSGKVEVINGQGENVVSTLLIPDEMVQINIEKGEMLKRKFDYNEEFGWKDNLIYFKNANIEKIFSDLEKWYGVEFLINKKIDLDRDFSGSYRDKSLEVVLEGVSYAFGFHYKIDKEYVTIN